MQTHERPSIIGECRGFQTYLEYEPNEAGVLMPIDTKIKVPGTDTGWVKNAIQDGLLNYIAYKIGTDTNDQALDDLHAFNTNHLVSSNQEGEDGISHFNAGTADFDYYLVTTLNDGGGASDGYIEFYGYIDGAVTLDGSLYLGNNYEHANEVYEFIFSIIPISQTVLSARRYGHYWKLTPA